MTEWRDEALVLSLRPHGEAGAIVELFSKTHGRHAGLVRGGISRRLSPHLQPGTQVEAQWRQRLGEQLGVLTVEPLRSRAHLMADRLDLAGLGAICVLLQLVLPERAPDPQIWRASMALLDQLGQQGWPLAYLRWELQLLDDLGYGLDLRHCALSGATAGLEFISPRSGSAVTRQAAGEWAPKLMPLPPLLLRLSAEASGHGAFGAGAASEMPDAAAAVSREALLQGLAITGHFLLRVLSEHHGRSALPEARGRLLDLLARQV